MDNSNSLQDQILFKQIAEGDAVAFSKLFRLHYAQLHANALRILKSEFWAEEAVQDCFVQLWASRELLPDIDAPKSYLYRIVANRCFDRLRKNDAELRLQYGINLLATQQLTVAQEHGFDLAVLQDLVNKALEQLPPQQQLIYKMQYTEFLSYQEIADKLGLSRHTVRNHMAKAIQSVRAYVEQHGGELLVLQLSFQFFSHFLRLN